MARVWFELAPPVEVVILEDANRWSWFQCLLLFPFFLVSTKNLQLSAPSISRIVLLTWLRNFSFPSRSLWSVMQECTNPISSGMLAEWPLSSKFSEIYHIELLSPLLIQLMMSMLHILEFLDGKALLLEESVDLIVSKIERSTREWLVDSFVVPRQIALDRYQGRDLASEALRISKGYWLKRFSWKANGV